MRLALAALFLVAAPAAAQDAKTYTLKLKRPAAGDGRQSATEYAAKQVVEVFGPDGQALQKKDESGMRKFRSRETVLEVKPDAPKPTKLRRVYEHAEVAQGGGEPRKLSYHGKTVLIERQDDKYTFQVEGGEAITGEDAKELEREFDVARGETGARILMTDKPVKVGEEWVVDVAKVVKAVGRSQFTIDPAKSKVTGKLLKVYEKDGRPYADVFVRVDLVATGMAAGAETADLEQGKLHNEGTISLCIDGAVVDEQVTMKGGATIKTKPLSNGIVVSIVSEQKETAAQNDVAKK